MTDENHPVTELPEAPSTAQVDRMERAVFARLAADRRARGVRRGRVWAGVGAAAAVVVLAALIGPAVAGGSGGAAGSSADSVSLQGAAIEPAPVLPGAVDGGAAEGSLTDGSIADQSATGASGGARADANASAGREIATSGSVSLTVDDPTSAAADVAAAATDLGGYVESSTVGGGAVPVDRVVSDAWVQVRVPADSLQTLIDRLGSLGEVTASSVSRTDVTDQAVDLRARVDAAQASVTRLTELMAQAGSVADLLAAEDALAQRQAELESAQQQLASLEGQVQLSSLSVMLTARQAAVDAQPAGFLDGLIAGWNGLVLALNGVVIGLGFLLPWLVVVAAIGAVVWGVRRSRRRRRDRAATPPGESSPPTTR